MPKKTKKQAGNPAQYIGRCPGCGIEIKAKASEVGLAGSPPEFPTLIAGHCGLCVPMSEVAKPKAKPKKATTKNKGAKEAGKKAVGLRAKAEKAPKEKKVKVAKAPKKPKEIAPAPILPSEEEIIGASLTMLDILWERTLTTETALDRKDPEFQNRFMEGCFRLRLINKEREARRDEAARQTG